MLNLRYFIVLSLFSCVLFYHQPSSSLELYSSRTNFPYTRHDKSSLREQVLKSSDKLLRENTLFLDENTHSEILDYAKNHPFIGYLSECQSAACPLNRIKKPGYREKFDEYVAQLLYDYSKQGTKRVRYASYAAGELFGDLVIAAKALAKGVKQLDISIIEPTYTLYKTATQTILDSYYNYCMSSKQALLEQLLKSPLAATTCLIKRYMPDLLIIQRFDTAQEFTESSLLKNPALPSLFLAQNINTLLAARILEYQNERFKQFLEFFAYTYPQAQVRLFIYSSLEDFLKSSKANTLDMLTLTDPEQKDQANLQQNFKDLAYSRLKIGGKAVFLAKPPVIITYLKTSKNLANFTINL